MNFLGCLVTEVHAVVWKYSYDKVREYLLEQAEDGVKTHCINN